MTKKFNLFDPQYAARSWFIVFNSLFFILLMCVMIIPILKILSDSLVNETVYGLELWPKEFNLIAYKKIFTTESLIKPLGISVLTTLATTFFGLLISTLGAYVLIQKDMPGVKIFSTLLVFTMIFNGGLIPTFLVMKKIHLLNSLWAVILPMSMNVYNLVLMRSFFEQLPESLFEAAEIDGCTPMGIFYKIVLPLSKAALASIGLFFAVAAWSEYFHYVIYITSTDKYNFQYKLRDLFQDKQEADEGENINVNTLKSAAVIVSIVPFMFIYPFCQKYFMTGITMGAVKE